MRDNPKLRSRNIGICFRKLAGQVAASEAKNESGAGDEVRTRHPLLGKQMLCQRRRKHHAGQTVRQCLLGDTMSASRSLAADAVELRVYAQDVIGHVDGPVGGA